MAEWSTYVLGLAPRWKPFIPYWDALSGLSGRLFLGVDASLLSTAKAHE